jgi:hypothetical protein
MKFKNYLQAIQEMKISINFSEIEKNQYNSPDDIIAIIKNALNKNGYNCEIEETNTSWEKINHLTTLKINKY